MDRPSICKGLLCVSGVLYSFLHVHAEGPRPSADPGLVICPRPEVVTPQFPKEDTAGHDIQCAALSEKFQPFRQPSPIAKKAAEDLHAIGLASGGNQTNFPIKGALLKNPLKLLNALEPGWGGYGQASQGQEPLTLEKFCKIPDDEHQKKSGFLPPLPEGAGSCLEADSLLTDLDSLDSQLPKALNSYKGLMDRYCIPETAKLGSGSFNGVAFACPGTEAAGTNNSQYLQCKRNTCPGDDPEHPKKPIPDTVQPEQFWGPSKFAMFLTSGDSKELLEIQQAINQNEMANDVQAGFLRISDTAMNVVGCLDIKSASGALAVGGSTIACTETLSTAVDILSINYKALKTIYPNVGDDNSSFETFHEALDKGIAAPKTPIKAAKKAVNYGKMVEDYSNKALNYRETIKSAGEKMTMAVKSALDKLKDLRDKFAGIKKATTPQEAAKAAANLKAAVTGNRASLQTALTVLKTGANFYLDKKKQQREQDNKLFQSVLKEYGNNAVMNLCRVRIAHRAQEILEATKAEIKNRRSQLKDRCGPLGDIARGLLSNKCKFDPTLPNNLDRLSRAL